MTFTAGDIRYIKRHTSKSLKELKQMKSSEKRYQVNTTEAIEFWNRMFSRMGILLKLIDACKPNRSIDDTDYRWVEDRIEYWQTTDRMLTKDEMRVSNNLWNKYGGPHNVVRNG